MADHTQEHRPGKGILSALHWLHWLILGLSLLATLAAYYITDNQSDQKVAARFERESSQIVELILERMQNYEDALWSGVSAIQSHGGDVTYDQWLTFASSLRIEQKHPGINGIGVIHFIPPQRLQSYLYRQRLRRPGYHIHPPHSHNEYWPITYIEPVDINREAVGLDMAHEENRFTAARKARDTGTAQITGPIILVQDKQRTPGFLFFAPFYSSPVKDTAERRRNFVGMEYAPFVVKKLMLGTLDRANRHVGIRLLDAGKIIYDEHNPEDPDFDPEPLYSTRINIPMYGRIWEFDMRSDSTFRALSFNPQPLTILIGGVAVDIMLMLLFIGLTQSNRKAAAYADRVTIELRQRKEELEKHNTTLHEQSKKLVQARQDADTARLAAEKIARARSAFLAIMSHELRTPLNGVIASAELLPGASSDFERGELIETILRSGQTLLALINDILDFSRLEAGKVRLTPRATSIQDAFNEIILMLQSMIASHHDTVTQYIAPDVPSRILIDPLRLEQILLNLASNAVKFTNYGAVRLECSVEERSNDQVSLLFEVVDSGIGIKDTSEIFNEFTQVNSIENQNQGGTGLGLAICKRLVEAMDGEIGVESEARVGSRFWFRVRAPIAHIPAQENESSDVVQRETTDTLAHGVALVVDDNEINLSITVRMLEHLGWKADQARDGREALEAARHKRYHIIFMDCRMPVMDGYEATRRIRELRPAGEPIVALTANALPEDEQRCLAAGMSDHLGKPIDLDHMRNMLIKWGPKLEQSTEINTSQHAGN